MAWTLSVAIGSQVGAISFESVDDYILAIPHLTGVAVRTEAGSRLPAGLADKPVICLHDLSACQFQARMWERLKFSKVERERERESLRCEQRVYPLTVMSFWQPCAEHMPIVE